MHSSAYPSHNLDYKLWSEKKKAADVASIEALQALGAHVRHDWHGAALKLGGVRSTCTGGIGGVMNNWLNAARKKIEERAE